MLFLQQAQLEKAESRNKVLMEKLSPRKDKGFHTSPWNILPDPECRFLLFKVGGCLVLPQQGLFQGRGKQESYTIVCLHLVCA